MQDTWNARDIDLTGFLHYMQHPGQSTDNASISQVFTKLGVNDEMLTKLLEIPDVVEFLDRRYKPAPFSIESLLALDKQSFGYQWAHFMVTNQLDPHFFVNDHHDDPRTYLINRMHDTHDMWHVLLGFDTSEAGAAGMNAFTYAQCFSPTTCLLMAAKLVRAINGPENIRRKMMNNIIKGYQLGQESKSLIAVALEEYWGEPLSQLRVHLGLPSA